MMIIMFAAMIFALAGGSHVQPGSFADRHIWLTLLILGVCMSSPLVVVLIFVQILKKYGIIKNQNQSDPDSEKEEKPKRDG